MPEYDTLTLYQELVDHGLIVPVGVLGAFGRSSVFEDVLERLDALIVKSVNVDLVESMTFPPIIDRKIIERTGSGMNPCIRCVR